MKKFGVSYFIRRFLLLIGLALSVGGLSLVGTTLAQSGANAGWVEIGAESASGHGISKNALYSFYPSTAIGPDDAPIVAWYSNENIYVRRWDGVDWVEMGAGSANGGGISKTGFSHSPSLAVGPDGAPIVAWYDRSSDNEEIYVRRWNGSTWAEMGAGSATGGGISNSAGYSVLPSLAIGPDNAPVVAWHDFSNGNDEIYVRRWDGSAWVEVGAGSATGGGISNNAGPSHGAVAAVGPDGAPVVAWIDKSSGNREIYVRRWDGSAWVEIGDHSATGGGISNNGGYSSTPSVKVGPDGTLVVAWHDAVSGNDQIYVRRWNGSAWVEMDAGSATGGGISNSSGWSRSPSLAINSDGVFFVAWDDDTSTNSDIYARRYETPHRLFTPLVISVPSRPRLVGSNDFKPNNSAGQAIDLYDMMTQDFFRP